MATLMKRELNPEDSGLSKQVIGNAMVVHPTGPVTEQARDLAVRLPRDDENDLVMLDLPLGSPITLWQSVASVIDRHRRGIRLVIDGHPRETVALAAGWLSERLGRVVIAADGQMFTGAGGCLFVDSGPNTGWMRFHPGRAPQWESKRFPRPFWDSRLTAEVTATSALSVCEPLPGGLWLRPIGSDDSLQKFRALLFESVPLLADTLTIVVGSPGDRAVPLDDVNRVRESLPPEVRRHSRLASLGPVSIEPGSTLGQSMADLTGEHLISYNGIPVGGDTRPPEVRAVQPDGRGGGWPFALELGYRPSTPGGIDPVPEVLSHRRPFRGLTEITPGVYRHGHDALVEVVQSGLLVRPVAEGARTPAVRQLAMDSGRHYLVVDGEDAGAVLRMQTLAEDLIGQLDEPTRRMTQIVVAETLLGGSSAGLMAEEPGEAAGALESVLNQLASAADESIEDEVFSAPAASTVPVPETPAQPAEPAPTPAPRVAPRTAPAPFRLESSGFPGAVEAPSRAVTAPGSAAPAPAAPLPTAPAAAPPVERSAPPPIPTSSPLPTAAPAPAPAPAAAPAGPAGPAAPAVTAVPDQPAAPAPVEAGLPTPGITGTGAIDVLTEPESATPKAPVEVKARLQPTPPPAARGLLPDRPIDEERAWLRKALAADFGTMSTSVARVLSEHPGFEGLRDGSSAALTDAVAVRLYLSPRGATLDAALRTGKVGPHIPLARCLVAGLSRLPSHRGPTSFASTPKPGHWELYRRHPKVTEWGFINAVAGPSLDQPGDTDVLVWSMTGRRTRLLEAENGGVPNRVLFVPGTQFKVLELNEPGPKSRGLIMMRELTARDLDDQGQGEAVQRSFDELALTSMRREHESWSTAARSGTDDGPATHFGALPGLV
jgi:hypothetical protein